MRRLEAGAGASTLLPTTSATSKQQHCAIGEKTNTRYHQIYTVRTMFGCVRVPCVIPGLENGSSHLAQATSVYTHVALFALSPCLLLNIFVTA